MADFYQIWFYVNAIGDNTLLVNNMAAVRTFEMEAMWQKRQVISWSFNNNFGFSE
jgi:hypothetical protein